MPLPRLSARLPGPGQYSNAAQRSRQVVLYQPGAVDTTTGVQSSPDPAGPPVWAAARPLVGEEFDKAQQIAQGAGHLVNIGYQFGVTENMLVQLEGRFFQIKYIEDPDELHWELNLYCAEVGQNAGQQT